MPTLTPTFEKTVKPELVWDTVLGAIRQGYNTFTFKLNDDGSVTVTGK